MRLFYINICIVLVTLVTSVAHGTDFPGAGAVDWLFGSGSFGRQSSPIADKDTCVARYLKSKRFMEDTSWIWRNVPERSPIFEDDHSFLEELNLVRNRLGLLDSKYVPEFDTRVYYSATGKPEADGSVPMVDPAAPALFVYFHGSGTKAANGGTGALKMNKLAEMGFANLSIDLPFHGDGTRDPSKAIPEVFAKYVKSMIDKYRRPGQKVVLWGHSFGPDVVFELLTRYPDIADAVVGFSPGSFDKETMRFYTQNTARMAESWANVEKNEEGAHWATTLGQNLAWKDLSLRKLYGLSDPTLKSDAKVIVLSGDREEFIPGPLLPNGRPADAPRTYDIRPTFKKYFAKADVVIEPGAGHLIFNHLDANGHDVMLRELLRSIGYDIKDETALRKQTAERRNNDLDKVAISYSREPFFKRWFDSTFGEASLSKAIETKDQSIGTKILSAWKSFESKRIEDVFGHIRDTKNWAPQFYNANKELIDPIGTKGYDGTKILIAYRKFLAGIPYNEKHLHAYARSPEFTRVDLDTLTAPKKDISASEDLEQLLTEAKSDSPQARESAAKALGKLFMTHFGPITNKVLDSEAEEVARSRGGSNWSAITDFKSKDKPKAEKASHEIFDLFLRQLSARKDQLNPAQVDLLNRLQLAESTIDDPGFSPDDEVYREIQSIVIRMASRLSDWVKKYEQNASANSMNHYRNLACLDSRLLRDHAFYS
jgi:pimeloyl-ACP methyl ester carboxylesterase